MKAGRGYVIRFFEEKHNFALFFSEEQTLAYRKSNPYSKELKEATIFTDHAEAVKKLIELKKPTKKLYKKGYLYISKVFYKEVEQRYHRGTRLVATKLTKPDRHDFLEAI